MKLKFDKENDGKWYVDLPEWLGPKEALEMVCGADTMLDILSQGEGSIYLDIVTDGHSPVFPKVILSRNHEEVESGSFYDIKWGLGSTDLTTFKIWLCDVTEFVFGEFPETIFII
jgi:hypothetical protein